MSTLSTLCKHIHPFHSYYHATESLLSLPLRNLLNSRGGSKHPFNLPRRDILHSRTLHLPPRSLDTLLCDPPCTIPHYKRLKPPFRSMNTRTLDTIILR